MDHTRAARHDITTDKETGHRILAVRRPFLRRLRETNFIADVGAFGAMKLMTELGKDLQFVFVAASMCQIVHRPDEEARRDTIGSARAARWPDKP